MKKPWEETWSTDPNALDRVRNEEGRRVLTAEAAGGSTTDDDARARLAAAAPEMARLLLQLSEGSTAWDCFGACPSCDNYEKLPPDGSAGTPLRYLGPGKHPKDCEIASLLRKAGVDIDVA